MQDKFTKDSPVFDLKELSLHNSSSSKTHLENSKSGTIGVITERNTPIMGWKL